jgi:polygalacturonase
MIYFGCLLSGALLVMLFSIKHIDAPIVQASTVPTVSRSFDRPGQSLVKVYPTATAAPASAQYLVTINGQPVFVERYNNASYVHFAFAGKVDLTVTMTTAQGDYQVSPQRRAPEVVRQGNRLSFSMTQPQKLVVHNRDLNAEQLFILADAWETAQPPVQATNLLSYAVDNTGQQDVTEIVQQAIDEVAAQRGVLYIPPGIYQIQQINLKSNLTLYLAGGAILAATRQTFPAYGQGLLNLSDVNNVKILGPGTILGNGSYWRPKNGWYTLLNIAESSNVLVKDILLRDPAVDNIAIEYSQNVTIENSKILASPQPKFINTDGVGIWSSRNVTIDDILYRGTDDATSQGGDKAGTIQNNENINIKNSTFMVIDAGGAFKIGSTIEQDLVRQVTYENIDIIHAEEIAGFWPVAGGRIEDIYLKNIHVEAIGQSFSPWGGSRLFEWRVMEANWEKNSSANRLGSIRNIYVSNLKVQNIGRNTSLFQGYGISQNISDVLFENFFLRGQPVKVFSQPGFQVLPSDRDQQLYVNNFNFTHRNPTLVRIEAVSGRMFQISRSGQLDTPLTIAYQIRGTAKNGIDYQTIANQVTIPAGQSMVAVPIVPIGNQATLKTVWLRLENLPHSLQYLLDAKYQDVLTLSTG